MKTKMLRFERNRKMIPLIILLLVVSASMQAFATETVYFGAVTLGTSVSDLDLTGNFTYAINAGGGAGTWPIGDANFVSSAPGVSIIFKSPIHLYTNNTPNFGNTNLNEVLSTIDWSDSNTPPPPYDVTVTLDVVAGDMYKLQTIHWESYNVNPIRSENVVVDGALAVKDMNIPITSFKVFTYEFNAPGNIFEFGFTAPTDFPAGTDMNPTLNAFTLEQIAPVPEPASMIILGSGLLGFAGFARKRFKK